LVQAGTLQGHGVTVSSSGTLTQQGRIVAGNGASTLSAAAISQTESGSIQGGGPLSLLADGDITNRGFVGTAGDLRVQAGGVIDNGGLLYGGGNLWLLSAALVNRFGNILAGNSLWIQRDAAGNASGSVLNSSGTIETQRGDITVRTGTLTNQREGLVVTESGSTAADMPDWVGGTTIYIPVERFEVIKDYLVYSFEDTVGPGSDSPTTYNYFYPFPLANIIKQEFFASSKTVNIESKGDYSLIHSAGNINFFSSVLVNDASVIASEKNILMNGGILKNNSYQSGTISESLVYEYERDDKDDFLPYIEWLLEKTKREEGVSDYDYWEYLSGYNIRAYNRNILTNDRFKYVLKDRQTTFTPGQTYAATIQAGGAITASFSQNISNTNLQPGSGGFMPAMATPTLAGVNAPAPVGAQADRGLNGGSATTVSGSALSGTGNRVA
ncbi:hemolysin BL-binding protein, partial [Dickeya dianthicola]|nr:hemolysin BL-binding protein [Dickeya dianthicola]